MQFAHALGAFPSEPATQEVGKEAMVPVPAPLVVERYDEEVLLLQPLQHFVSIVMAGEGITQ